MNLYATLRRIAWLCAGVSLGHVVPLGAVFVLRAWRPPPAPIRPPSVDVELLRRLTELALYWPLVAASAALLLGLLFSALALWLRRLEDARLPQLEVA